VKTPTSSCAFLGVWQLELISVKKIKFEVSSSKQIRHAIINFFLLLLLLDNRRILFIISSTALTIKQ
jgi:hypothetical protein